MDYSDAWQNEEHSKQFGKAIRKKNLTSFFSKFQRYLPARCLNYLIYRSADKNISNSEQFVYDANYCAKALWIKIDMRLRRSATPRFHITL